jgi:hypothetical protein
MYLGTALDFLGHSLNWVFGRSPSGRAIRCNLFAFRGKKISTAIPNAKQHSFRMSSSQYFTKYLFQVFKSF